MTSRTRRIRNFVILFSLSILAGWFILPPAIRRTIQPTALAAPLIFTVNATGDAQDANIGDGICLTQAGNCSLRAAMQEANLNPGMDTINFNIPGGGVKTIKPGNALPNIISPVLIDGYTQPGASQNTLAVGDNAVLRIEIDGTNAGPTEGLIINTGGAGSTLQGLAINNFAGQAVRILVSGNRVQGNFIGINADGTASPSKPFGIGILANNNQIGDSTPAARNVISNNQVGIDIQAGTGNKIQGNYLGTDKSGATALGNILGVLVRAGSPHDNLIGGTSPGAGNLISGNDIAIQVEMGSNNVIQGNLIGTDASGTAAIPNTTACSCGAVRIIGTADNTIIGGLISGARNVISGNNLDAIEIGTTDAVNYPTNTKVQGNFIGTDITGAGALANTGAGVRLGASGTFVGPGNVIAFNGKQGVLVENNQAEISSNSIFSNTLLGIDLRGDGVTPNDAGDADTGPNNLQNFPSLGSVTQSNDVALISGNLVSTPNASFQIELFSNPSCDSSGNGEGHKFINSTTATTDSSGNSSFFTAAHMSDLSGPFITAIATDQNGNTSEFSACVQLASSPSAPPAISLNDVTVNEGNSGTTNAVFTVTLSATSSSTVSVNFATADITANAGSDYVANSGTVIFNSGVTSQTVTVAVNGDFVPESTEAFFVNLSSPMNATISRAAGIGKITNDDAQASLQFSASNYNVTEDCTSVPITVMRTGDNSVGMDVDYTTASGSASDRTDYTFAAGTLHFAPGDTSKSFNVLITEDSLAEGTESATITLSNPMGGAVVGNPGMATLTILDDTSEPATNSIDDTSLFVKQHYHDFLNRQGDAQGEAFWISNIDSCGSAASCREVRRIDTSASFFLSIEFQQTGFLVERAYQVAFNRRVLINEFLPDTQTLGRGVVVGATGWEQQLEANKQTYFNQLVTRPEFLSLYSSLTNAPYVDALNANTGGSLTTADRDALVNGLGSGTETRATVLRKVSENATFSQREFNRAFVLMEYFGYLRRNPDESGFQFWLNKLNAFNGDFRAAEMVKAFITSFEYRGRFGSP